MTALANAIARDILADRSARNTAPVASTCFACGRSYGSGDGRFCSERCRDAFDAGFPPYDPQSARSVLNVPLRDWVVVAGPPGTPEQLSRGGTRPYGDARPMTISSDGFLTDCKGCRKSFVSRGLRWGFITAARKSLDPRMAASPATRMA
jgi:hypothetical protein